MKNTIITVLGFAVVGLGAYVVGLKTAAKQAPAPVPASASLAALDTPPPLPEPVKPPSVMRSSEVVFPDPDDFVANNAAVEQLGKANDLIVALHEQNQSLEADAQPSLAKGLQQIVDSPELKEMMRAGMSRGLKRSHGGLFRKLGLSEEQEAVMSEIILDQNIEGIANGIQWITGNVEESAARMVESRDKVHAGIREKLGVEVLAEYEYWEDSKNERESVQKFNRSLGEAGLDEATNDELVGMLYDARADFPELERLSKPENYDPREMNADRREDLLGQVEELHGVYMQDAGQVLNQEQLVQLETSLGKQRQELDGFMKFTHGMFNRSQELQPQP